MRTIIIVQCRLSSTRLPQKALYQLDNDVLLGWALKSMHKVNADDYFVACDVDSKSELAPVSCMNNFKIFAGSKDDVLDRFCRLIECENPDIVVRATADNPFLFYDAAQELLDIYKDKYFDSVDYITFSGLPHGSGIEIFKASSLLKARTLTDLPYDHEHVGPSLYNHPENFKSLFLPAPAQYNAPQLRTTIDTYADYLRACDVIEMLKNQGISSPYKSKDVLKCYKIPSIEKKILYIPSIKATQGTGHLRRCVELAKKTQGVLFLDEENFGIKEGSSEKNLIDYSDCISQFDSKRIIKKLPLQNEYDLVVCDLFKMSEKDSFRYLNLGKTVLIDEGSDYTDQADFLLDIIPSNLKRRGNISNPGFIPSPENVNSSYSINKAIKKVLISFGGEDPAGLTQLFIPLFVETECMLTVISAKTEKLKDAVPALLKSRVQIIQRIENLKEHLCEYDLVITHYGFTAFECVYSNTPVLLAATSKLHKKLSDKYGFTCLTKKEITKKKLFELLNDRSKLMPSFKFEKAGDVNLSSYLLTLAKATLYNCPICRQSKKGILVERTIHHTFRQCPDCKMVFISFSDDSESVKYEKSYFAEEYKKQYGKTYLEDFEAIKKNCVGRVSNIDKVLKIKNGSNKSILDIGCAYGPFLKAASEDQWTPFGSDIAVDAIEYVKSTLGFKATNASFADIDLKKEFGIEELDAVSMWYVIEHIKDLQSTLTAVNKMLKKGGIFAFSTPNAAGLSRKVNQHAFFTNSPKDHYSLWQLPDTQKYLKRFGFKVCKIVPTGIHPERIPFVQKNHISPDKLTFKMLKILMKLKKNGDTYEVYCQKISGITDEQ